MTIRNECSRVHVRHLLTLLAILLSCFVISCGGGSSAAGGSSTEGDSTGASSSNSPTLSSIQVFPANPTLAVGLSQQFLAIGAYSDGSTADITTSVVWSSTTPNSAIIASSGMATTVNQGTTSIVAASASIQGSTVLTVPSAMGGLIANTNPTDSLVLSGTDSNGAKVNFYGARNEDGIPQSIYAVSAQQTDGSVQSVGLSSNGQIVTAYDTRGFNYSFQWSSATQGVVTLNTNDGTQSVSTSFDLSTASSSSTSSSSAVAVAKTVATTAARRAALAQTHKLQADTTQSPVPGDVTVEVATSCGGSFIPETQATVSASLTSPSGYAYHELLPLNEQNGYYAISFPTLGVSVNAATDATAVLGQLESLCEAGPGNTGISYLQVSKDLCEALSTIVLPEGELEGWDQEICEYAVHPAEYICDGAPAVSSWLDSYLNTALTLSVNVSLGADILPPENIQINPTTGLPASMEFIAPCPAVSSVRASSELTLPGAGWLLQATALNANNQIIQSNALTWAWTTSNSNIVGLSNNLMGTQVATAGPFVFAIGEASGTATVTAAELSSGKQGTVNLTVSKPTTYTYTGEPFTSFQNQCVSPYPSCGSPGTSITASFTFAAPLPPYSSWGAPDWPYDQPTPALVSWTISSGARLSVRPLAPTTKFCLTAPIIATRLSVLLFRRTEAATLWRGRLVCGAKIPLLRQVMLHTDTSPSESTRLVQAIVPRSSSRLDRAEVQISTRATLVSFPILVRTP